MRSLQRTGALALAAAALLLMQSSATHAQQWPSKPIKWLVPVAPGGATDATARLLQEPVSKILGQPIIIENKPGGAGVIATEAAVRSPPDGYTFGIVYTSHAGNPALLGSLPYDSVKDVTPVAFFWRAYLAFAVHPDVPIKTLAEMIARAKKEPGTLAYATGGVGLAAHFAGARLEQEAGIKMTHTPYRGGGPALTDVLGGHVPVLIANISVVQPYVESGKIRVIAVTSPQRSPLLPNIPTVAESGFPGYQVSEWFGFIGPAGLPSEVVQKMNAAINEAARQPNIAEQIAKMGIVVNLGTPEAFRQILAEETQITGDVIRKGNIKP